mmetsp:Transcript_574/g.1322  ORF Transcript_574/g.1322 Transcript_574/m.1322 type:complete len:241 (-) Transcript_574:592-1314(-)
MYFLRRDWGMRSLFSTPSSAARRKRWGARAAPRATSLVGTLIMWLSVTKLARRSSATGSTTSCSTQRQSKRCRIGSVSSTFSDRVQELSYRPPMGLAAAITEQRAWRDVTIPALETEMDCCSMASWMEVRSCSFILSNSSMRQTPRSARTSAPPSRVHSFVSGSLCTFAVSPTALAPFPVLYTALGAVASAYLSIWLLAVPGSPRTRTLTSPRMRCLSSTFLGTAPKRDMANAIFTCSWP